MTVNELIIELQKFPGHLRVVIPGYEYGADDPAPLRMVIIGVDANTKADQPDQKREWFAGRHELKTKIESADIDIEAVLLGIERDI